jgi:hypothetical protein
MFSSHHSLVGSLPAPKDSVKSINIISSMQIMLGVSTLIPKLNLVT